MRLLGFMIAVCLAMAALKVAAAVLVLVIIAALVIGIVTRPAETIGGLLAFAALGAFGQHPVVGMVILGLVTAVGLLAEKER